MREGSVYRRCGSLGCRARVAPKAKTCQKCGGESISWGFTVDLAVVGAPRRQRQRSGFATKAEAVEALTRLQSAVTDGVHVEPSRRTVAAYLTDWLAGRSNIRPNTLAEYGVSIRNHIVPRLGDLPLQAVDRVQIRALYRSLVESGLSPKSVFNIHICLRKALQDAVDDGLIKRNVADKGFSKPKDRPQMSVWSAAELTTFLDFTANDPDHGLYRLAATTGMRRGELLGLRWRDCDLDAGRVTIRQQFTRQGRGLGFGPPKSAKSIRTIDLDPITAGLLRDQWERQRFARRSWEKAYAVALDLVFCRPDGQPEDPDEVGRRFVRRVADIEGLPKLSLHGLRHTMATLLLADGIDAKTVSERLGHDSIGTTLTLYAWVTPTMRSNAAVRFGNLLDQSRARSLEIVTQP